MKKIRRLDFAPTKKLDRLIWKIKVRLGLRKNYGIPIIETIDIKKDNATLYITDSSYWK